MARKLTPLEKRWRHNHRFGEFVQEKRIDRTKEAKRQRELEKISFVRKLTDAEMRELRKLDYLEKVEGSFAEFLEENREENAKYAQYLHDVPKWAQK